MTETPAKKSKLRSVATILIRYWKVTLPVLAILLAIGWWYEPYVNADWVIGTVTSKAGNPGDGNYIIAIKRVDGSIESLGNQDVGWRFKWNSTDIQGGIQENKKYNFKVLGRRVQSRSQYRNILKYEEILE